LLLKSAGVASKGRLIHGDLAMRSKPDNPLARNVSMSGYPIYRRSLRATTSGPSYKSSLFRKTRWARAFLGVAVIAVACGEPATRPAASGTYGLQVDSRVVLLDSGYVPVPNPEAESLGRYTFTRAPTASLIPLGARLLSPTHNALLGIVTRVDAQGSLVTVEVVPASLDALFASGSFDVSVAVPLTAPAGARSSAPRSDAAVLNGFAARTSGFSFENVVIAGPEWCTGNNTGGACASASLALDGEINFATHLRCHGDIARQKIFCEAQFRSSGDIDVALNANSSARARLDRLIYEGPVQVPLISVYGIPVMTAVVQIRAQAEMDFQGEGEIRSRITPGLEFKPAVSYDVGRVPKFAADLGLAATWSAARPTITGSSALSATVAPIVPTVVLRVGNSVTAQATDVGVFLSVVPEIQLEANPVSGTDNVRLTVSATGKTAAGVFLRTLFGNNDSYSRSVDLVTANLSSWVVAKPGIIRTLTVQSDAPVVVTITPADLNGAGNGTTPFTRIHADNVVVTLTAPATAGDREFERWERNGVSVGTTPTVTVSMNADQVMKAIYRSNFTIAGRVTTSTGANVSGVAIAFTGLTPVTTGNDGTYSKTVSAGYSGTATPTKTGCTFTPPTRTYNDLNAATVGDYTASCPVTSRTLTVQSDPNVAVTVTPADLNGAGNGTTPFTRIHVDNVAVTLTAPATAGDREFERWERNGVSVGTTPTVTVSMNADQVMKAIYRSNFTIAGRVTTSTGANVSGVAIAFTGLTPVTTGNDGTYSKTVPAGYSGTATPTKIGCFFMPTTQTHTNVTTSLANQNFVSTCGSTVGVTLKNVDGLNASSTGTRCLLYTTPIREIRNANPAVFNDVPPGTYLTECYFTGTFFGEEFWTSQQVTVPSMQSMAVTLTRVYPFGANVVIKNDATGAVLSAGQVVPSGMRLRAEITVRNNVPNTSLSSTVRLLFDRNQAAGYDSDQTSVPQTISGSGGTKVYTFTYTPTNSGNYYYAIAVHTTVNSSIMTDSWLWVQTVTR
jgi:hypothetical protein